MIADILTISRMAFSLPMFVLSPSSASFLMLYLLCGVTDALDGFAARRLHTESEKGARLDSAADLLFALVYAVKILPALSVPLWIWVWTAIIAAVKLTGIAVASKKANDLRIGHSFGNKLTGLLLFLLPLSAFVTDVQYGAVLACIAATVTAGMEINDMKRRNIP